MMAVDNKPELFVKRSELGLVKVSVTASNNEVRVWCCDPKKGMSVMRIKALGKVTCDKDLQEIIVTQTVMNTTALRVSPLTYLLEHCKVLEGVEIPYSISKIVTALQIEIEVIQKMSGECEKQGGT